jgi:hypothetical protein
MTATFGDARARGFFAAVVYEKNCHMKRTLRYMYSLFDTLVLFVHPFATSSSKASRMFLSSVRLT